jgi:hypothetical protein
LPTTACYVSPRQSGKASAWCGGRFARTLKMACRTTPATLKRLYREGYTVASAEQIKALLKSHIEGDDPRFFSVAMQVAARVQQAAEKRSCNLDMFLTLLWRTV